MKQVAMIFFMKDKDPFIERNKHLDLVLAQYASFGSNRGEINGDQVLTMGHS